MYSHWPDQERYYRNTIIRRLTFYSCAVQLHRPVQMSHEFDQETINRERRRLDECTTGDLQQLLAQLYWEFQQAWHCLRCSIHGNEQSRSTCTRASLSKRHSCLTSSPIITIFNNQQICQLVLLALPRIQRGLAYQGFRIESALHLAMLCVSF